MLLLHLHAKGIKLNDNIREFVDHKLHFALDRFGQHALKVDVRLDDINGPRGGADKRCRVVISLSRTLRLVITQTGENLMAVVADAVNRAEHALSRLLNRKNTNHRRPIPVRVQVPE